jgi:hypothetical protein
MAGAIRFTKAEREWMRGWLENAVKADAEVGDTKAVRAGESVLKKLELAELPVKQRSYLTVPDAIKAFREVLGPRLLAPRYEARGVLGQMKNRIQALGLTRSDCTTIAKVAGAEWKGVIRAESLVRQADKLLAGAQMELPATSTPHLRDSSPVELSDDEI